MIETGCFSQFNCKRMLGLLCILLHAGLLLAEDVLVLRPDEKNFKMALTGLTEQLEDELTIYDFLISENTTLEDFEAVYKRINPKIFVMMDTRAVSLYTRYQAKHPKDEFPPCLVIMTSYAEERIKSLKNTVGIVYEIQGVTSLMQVRTLVKDNEMKRVGVLYSTPLQGFFESQKENCFQEDIELVGYPIDPGKNNLYKIIKKGLKYLIKDQKVDAIWVLNDNFILKSEHLEWAWEPGLKKFKKPVVVSLEHLAFELKLGPFAVVPDHLDLGSQAGRMIFNIIDENWKLENIDIEKPIGVYKKINPKKVPKSIQLDDKILSEEWIQVPEN